MPFIAIVVGLLIMGTAIFLIPGEQLLMSAAGGGLVGAGIGSLVFYRL